ncbi:hypothetical protein MBLNU459_g7742t1 [Dothideomycetes sp. NU459]
MSDSEGSNQHSDGELAPEETLVHGRAKRSTAGNRLSYLLQHLEDEDVRNDLLAEDETDQLDYEASDDGGDVALESSDDSDDDGPPKEGEQEELQGEKELQKQERVEARRKKRKAQDFANIPLVRKKARIADDVSATTPSDASAAPARPRKKSERLSWLPTAEDAPTRQSMRGQTVANREVTEAKLVESQKRSEKAHELLKIAAERKAARAGPVLTQADRMAKALKVEKENARSLNRWEKSEEERQLAQRLKLEALRNRKLEGPVIRYWSGSVIWEGDKIKVKRVHKPKIEVVEEPTEIPSESEVKAETRAEPPSETSIAQDNASGTELTGAEETFEHIGADRQGADQSVVTDLPHVSTDAASVPLKQSSSTTNTKSMSDRQRATPPAQRKAETVQDDNVEAPSVTANILSEKTTSEEGLADSKSHDEMEVDSSTRGVLVKEDNVHAVHGPESASAKTPNLLDGIHYWASQSPAEAASTPVDEASMSKDEPAKDEQKIVQPTDTAVGPTFVQQEGAQITMPHDMPESSTAALHQAAPPPPDALPQPTQSQVPVPVPVTTDSTASTEPTTPAAPPVPLIREQALRTLTMLEAFPSLELPAAVSKKTTSASSAVSAVLLPDAFPPLTPAESKYLASKSLRKKDDNKLPPAPPRATCVISSKPARFRDPKTGMAYRDIGAYKALQSVIAGRTAWSGLLGAWSGIAGDGPMGRVAKGVPDCFWTGKREKSVKIEEGQTDAGPQGTPLANAVRASD